MVIDLSMSFDEISLPLPNNNNKTNTPPNLSTMDNNTPNSLKRVSPQFQYKYSKNKHLSQQIHKKKKNRTKQNHYKKKKLTKIKQNKPTNKKQSKPSKPKKPKLKKTLSLPINQNDDMNDFTYLRPKKHNEMNHKHKKIQVINNNTPYYYLQATSISNKNLNHYNYNTHKPMQPNISNANQHNSDAKTHHKKTKSNIIWLASPQVLKCSPSPMLLSNQLNLNQSPLLLPTNKGEVLMGFELSDIGNVNDLLPQKSNCQLSVISDYRYEGLQNYNNVDTINYNINNCLNTLKSVNSYKDNYTSKELCIDKLNEMEEIIRQLKNKIINDNEEKYEHDEDENDHENKRNELISTDNSQTDSSFLRSHMSNTNSSDEEHENEDEDIDEFDNDSNQSMIGGVKFMEDPTPNGNGSQVVYYD